EIAQALKDLAELPNGRAPAAEMPTAETSPSESNESLFLRSSKILAALSRYVLPKLLKDRAMDDPLRVWVPACGTGKQVYSLGISLLKYFDDRELKVPIKIFATDVHPLAIELARSGQFAQEIAQESWAGRLQEFFKRTGSQFAVCKRLR